MHIHELCMTYALLLYVGWVGAVQAYRYAPRPEKKVQVLKPLKSIRENFSLPNSYQKTRHSSSTSNILFSASTSKDMPIMNENEEKIEENEKRIEEKKAEENERKIEEKKIREKIESFRMSALAVNDKESLRLMDERQAERENIRKEKQGFQRSAYTNAKYEKKKKPAEGEGKEVEDKEGEGGDGKQTGGEVGAAETKS